MVPKNHYNEYDFIDKDEKIYTIISKGNDGLIPHNHDFYELVMVTNGHGTHIINDIIYHVVPGDIFLLVPSDIHSFVPIDDDTKFNWLSCIWLPEFYEVSAPVLKTTKKYQNENTYDIYNQLLDLHSEFIDKKEGYYHIIKLILEVIMAKLIRIANKVDDDYGLKHKKKLVKDAINYIQEKYSENIALSDIADHIMISEVYLCKLFKSQMKISAMEYLRNIRIEKSKQLLSSTDLKIEDVSSKVGFLDVKSFYSQFKKRMGVSPGAFRNHFN